ncbi:hypothetical protein L484_019748 [Morus notabilis]|uniref:DUF4283 domain-containing protein n=1 Tax=Morus notabilis TaxID=981085 RepID=W9QRH8_9ROSA|nr:hypothetical protein L484_019748 [Morus notabilis]
MVSLAADRAILWCSDEKEKSCLLAEPSILWNGRSMARIKPWSIYVHWDHVQIEVRNSWIGLFNLRYNSEGGGASGMIIRSVAMKVGEDDDVAFPIIGLVHSGAFQVVETCGKPAYVQKR